MCYVTRVPQWLDISGINAACPCAHGQIGLTRALRHWDESENLRFEHELQRVVRSLRVASSCFYLLPN